MAYRLTDDDRDAFSAQGYCIVPGLFDTTETALLHEITTRILVGDPHRLDRHDADGNVTRLSLRNELYDDVFSATVRCARVARTMQALLDGEVYHYHHKVMIKDPEVGGAWEWHQDYGYWYDNGCLLPDMGSCLVAITQHTRANGCLQVIPGSHKLGRLDHLTIGADQTGADPERVAHVLERTPAVHLELEPGSGVFFHANLLHRSDRNRSDAARLSLIDCFNTKRNDPVRVHHHPSYSPLEIRTDDCVVDAGRAQLRALRAQGSDASRSDSDPTGPGSAA